MTSPARFRRVSGDQLTARQLHDVLQLRTAVFVVEQACPYQEIDGADLLSSTEHLWDSDDDGITAYIRVMTSADTHQVGRVVTRPDARGRGLAKELLTVVLSESTATPLVLNAQTQLIGFYEELGFVLDGSHFMEDGIPHVPMRRPNQPVVQVAQVES